ncbi:MAG: hypothetical protein HFACDABA_01784 [Anaerolineales bacterium]|nr:hypothetical protein [Anaerolineales bacterium]
MSIPDPHLQSQLTPEELAAQRDAERQQRTVVITLASVAVVLLALLGTAIYFLMRPETSGETVGKVRDVFLIVMALMSLMIGVAVVTLVVQVASLINLVQNEIRPILKATNETVNTLRGTAEFLGENVVEPVVKLNGYLAGLQRVLELMGIKKK